VFLKEISLDKEGVTEFSRSWYCETLTTNVPLQIGTVQTECTYTMVKR